MAFMQQVQQLVSISIALYERSFQPGYALPSLAELDAYGELLNRIDGIVSLVHSSENSSIVSM